MKTTLNINTVSFRQMFNDHRGKTSLSLVCGFIIIVTSCGGFVAGISMRFNDAIMGATIFVGAGVALVLGKTFSKPNEISPDVSQIKETE